uniref:Normal mucosa of esophagus-specific 1 protein n=1 Tax=Hemiscolopendra marginata TaxID=943146 RepID=A0A646QCF6_9MYRI
MSSAGDHGKTFGFGFRALKKYPEIIPLVGIIGVACVGVVAYSIYCFTKSDVILDRSKAPPWERINPEQPQKLLVVQQEYKKNPELEKLKREMGDYK